MGIAAWWKGLFSKAPAPSGASSRVYSVGGKSAPPRKDTQAISEAYATSPWLYAPVTRLAEEAAAATVWQLFDQPERHPERKEIFDDPILNLLRSPNPEIDPFSFWSLIHGWRKSDGNAFVLVDTDALGVPKRLTPCAPQWVLGTPENGKPYYETSLTGADGKRVVVPASNMLWLKGLNLSNPYGRGVGPAQVISDELDTDEYASKNVKSWFFNGGLPDVIISAEEADAEELQRAEEKFRGRYGGPKNSHQIHWSGRKLDVQRLDTSFKEQDLVALRGDLRDTILRVYGIPPEIFGILENSNRATIDAAYYLLSKGVLFPMLKSLAGQLQLKLLPMFGGSPRYLGFVNPIPEDRDFQLRGVSVAPSAFQINEFRQLLGMLPMNGGDSQLTTGGVTSGETNLPTGV